MASNMQIPSMIKCCRCDQVKNSAAFPDKKLSELVREIKSSKIDPKRDAFIPCSACSVQQRVEMQCSSCDKYKSIDAFSKRQRKQGDEAMCEKCIKEQLDTEPAGLSDSDDGDEDDAAYSGDEKSKGSLRLPSRGGTIWSGGTVASRSTAKGSVTTASRSARTDRERGRLSEDDDDDE